MFIKKYKAIFMGAMVIVNTAMAMQQMPQQVEIPQETLQKLSNSLHDACLVGNFQRLAAITRHPLFSRFMNMPNSLGETPLYILAHAGVYMSPETELHIKFLITRGVDAVAVKQVRVDDHTIRNMTLVDALQEAVTLLPLDAIDQRDVYARLIAYFQMPS